MLEDNRKGQRPGRERAIPTVQTRLKAGSKSILTLQLLQTNVGQCAANMCKVKGNKEIRATIPTVQTRLKVGSKLPPLTLRRPCSGRHSFWGRKKWGGVNNFEGSAGNIAWTGRDGQLRMILGDLADCKSHASLTKHFGGILEEGSRGFAAF